MKNNLRRRGFTLLEIMVAMLVFGIGVLGFSAMLVTMNKGQRFSQRKNEAITLAQSQIEILAGESWDDIGTDVALPSSYGLDNALILNSNLLNLRGNESGGGEPGPFLYQRYVVICTEDEDAGSPGEVSAGSPEEYCGTLSDANRPQELACDNLTLTSREKMIRILISYRNSQGTCKYHSMDSLHFDWDG
ncbi:MAG: prepilin-type N-terminal cleavage/methylation domain-containing protein [Deltaproteobacteria bacterium]|nr:prepilin-type N-terminal cleavage/methylation domain-containing protein [Deltaproteobacteria bacterium]